MPIKCPPAPVAANPALVIQTAILKAGSALTRFHSKSRAGNIYNPNTGKRIEIEEEGARLNQFPGAPAANVPTLYAADNISAAALEPKKFNHVTAPASKNKDVTGVGFLFEDRLHLGTEPVEAAPHVCNTGGEPDPRACPQVDHRVRLSSTARITAGSAAPSMLSSARPGNSIVTL